MKGTGTLRRRTILGTIWAGIGQFGSQIVHYVVLLLLALLLTPSAFGLLGLAMIFVRLAQGVGELGLAAALIQQEELQDEMLNTAFWTNLLVSMVLALVVFLWVDQIATFMGDPDVAALLRVLSLIFPLNALAVIPRALLNRDLDFKTLTAPQFASEFAYGVAGIGLAIAGLGVWSLVAAVLAQQFTTTAVLWKAVPWRPARQYSLRFLKTLLSFGTPVMFAVLLGKGIANADYFVVGKWLGTEELGYYTLAFQLAVVPIQRLTGILRNVAFPSFSKVQNDFSRLKSGFLDGLQYLFALLIPIPVVLVFVSPWFIQAVYGQKWAPAVLPLQILALAGFFYGFDLSEAIYYAIGRPVIRIYIMALRLLLFLVAATTFGLSYGIAGVALSMTLAVAASNTSALIVIRMILNVSIRELASSFWRTTSAGVIASLFAMALLFVAPSLFTAPWLVATLLSAAILTIYTLCIAPIYYSQAGNLVRHFRQERSI